MGAVCVCGEDMDALSHLSSEERANVGSDKLKKANYIGSLYTLYMLESSADPQQVNFKPPTGFYPHFHTMAKV